MTACSCFALQSEHYGTAGSPTNLRTQYAYSTNPARAVTAKGRNGTRQQLGLSPILREMGRPQHCSERRAGAGSHRHHGKLPPTEVPPKPPEGSLARGPPQSCTTRRPNQSSGRRSGVYTRTSVPHARGLAASRANTQSQPKARERLEGQRLGEHIRDVVNRGELKKTNLPPGDTLTHVMINNINMLATILRQGIRTQGDGTSVDSETINTTRRQLKLPHVSLLCVLCSVSETIGIGFWVCPRILQVFLLCEFKLQTFTIESTKRDSMQHCSSLACLLFRSLKSCLYNILAATERFCRTLQRDHVDLDPLCNSDVIRIAGAGTMCAQRVTL